MMNVVMLNVVVLSVIVVNVVVLNIVVLNVAMLSIVGIAKFCQTCDTLHIKRCLHRQICRNNVINASQNE